MNRIDERFKKLKEENKVVEKIDSFMDDYTADEYMRIRNFL